MRTPSFMQGVVSRPSAPARFALIEKPTVHPEPFANGSGPAESKGAAAPPPPPMPALMPVALAELRPPPTPPRPQPANDAALQHAIEKLQLQNERLVELARSDALEIGFLVAERILEQEISQNPRALMSLVRSAMRRLAESRQITVTVSPADLERLKAHPEAQGLTNVKLEADPTFAPGDCKVSSELGIVDGRLSTRLAEVRDALEGEE